MNRAVFLDRDGVLNRVVVRAGRPYPPASLAEFELLPRVPEAVAALRAAGFCLVVVTNQPDVAKGVQDRGIVEAMHERLRRELPLDDVKVCYHEDRDGCACRKPKPGMVLQAASQWTVDLSRSFLVGDRWRDIEAGRAAGCKTILVRCEYDERPADRPDAIVNSLFEASELILSGGV